MTHIDKRLIEVGNKIKKSGIEIGKSLKRVLEMQSKNKLKGEYRI